MWSFRRPAFMGLFFFGTANHPTCESPRRDPVARRPHMRLPAVVKRNLDQLADQDMRASLIRLTAIAPNEVGQQTTLPMREAAPADARFEILRLHACGGLGEIFVAPDRESEPGKSL